jgi:hypothetical protein
VVDGGCQNIETALNLLCETSDMSISGTEGCFERPELIEVRDSRLNLQIPASDYQTLRQNCIHHCTWQQRAA